MTDYGLESPFGNLEFAFLIMEKGESTDGKFSINETPRLLGNSPEADIIIRNPFVSRNHLNITCRDSTYFVTDLGSKNGTAVNQINLLPHKTVKLEDGALISLANNEILLRFRQSEDTIIQSRDDSSVMSIVVNPLTRDVEVEGQVIAPALSKKEFDVLFLLYSHKGEAVHRDAIARQGWPERIEGDVGNQEIEQCMSRLRRRINLDPDAPELIMTLRGYGYKMR